MTLPKKFYSEAGREPHGGGFRVTLDGKPVRTPGKAEFVVPTSALADAVAAEWDAQGEHIQPASMPLTKLVNSAIDGALGREEAVKDDILVHAGSDLLFYRAEGPEELAARQAIHWDPVVDWARHELGAPFMLAAGVMPVTQPDASLARLREQLKGCGALGLTALHVMTALSGSALLALAVAQGRLTPEEAWAAGHVDEDFQISQWGEDAEAAARREERWRDFAAAARMLDLLKG